MREDKCFTTLILCVGFSEIGDPRIRERSSKFAEVHEKECGNCHPNVRITISRTSDPVKKRAYSAVSRVFMLEYLRSSGDRVDVEEAPEGTYYRAALLTDTEVPFTAVEEFRPRDRT